MYLDAPVGASTYRVTVIVSQYNSSRLVHSFHGNVFSNTGQNLLIYYIPINITIIYTPIGYFLLTVVRMI